MKSIGFPLNSNLKKNNIKKILYLFNRAIGVEDDDEGEDDTVKINLIE
jgi:hypothetical protein